MTKIFGLFLALVLVGCFRNASKNDPQVVVVNDVPADFHIPQELIKMIETELQIESKTLQLVFSYAPLKVLFTEKTAKTLVAPQLLYSLPKGGGQIDLQNVVSGQGSYFFSFPEEQFKNYPELSHLYYLSHSPKKNIGNEVFGIGCGKWMDLKSQFSALQSSNFLALNSTDNRHIFVATGHYIFVFRKLNQVLLTQVTITDSKNAFQLCPQIKGASL